MLTHGLTARSMIPSSSYDMGTWMFGAEALAGLPCVRRLGSIVAREFWYLGGTWR